MSEKIEKNKAEKILTTITKVWAALGFALCCLVYFSYSGLVATLFAIMFLCTFVLVLCSLVLAAVARIKKAPKIRARYWMNFVWCNLLFLLLSGVVVVDYLTSDDSVAYKPIIYLYPQGPTEVTVELGKPENLTHTYPKYNKLWTVIARPGGELTDSKTGRHYYALYWEGKNTLSKGEMTEGFVVEGKKTIPFLEEKLAKLGLTDREAEEFIVYWLPKMESNAYNYVRFQTMEEQEENMPLTISPPPTTLIRVMMEFKGLDEPIEVKEQELPKTPERTGFVVVEWGGTEL